MTVGCCDEVSYVLPWTGIMGDVLDRVQSDVMGDAWQLHSLLHCHHRYVL